MLKIIILLNSLWLKDIPNEEEEVIRYDMVK